LLPILLLFIIVSSILTAGGIVVVLQSHCVVDVTVRSANFNQKGSVETLDSVDGDARVVGGLSAGRRQRFSGVVATAGVEETEY